eukprot:TRINITY_DN33767_c0_g1_i1.p1 TRINITY_DN33767_c0_g1~~TRINITY_DN33767_c0_g1_i1.p1  ORF type:complete len:269 (+),score=36.09 TRINITY_DN33767_c0_g1_i1:100-906(+)
MTEAQSPLCDYHVHIDDDTFMCCPLPKDHNVRGVVLAHRLDRLQDLAKKNFNLSILCLVYIAVNFVCLGINFCGQYYGYLDIGSHDLVFHLIEFWATFAFSVIQVYSLVYSPRSLGSVYSNTFLLKLVIFFNVVATFSSALLVAVSLEWFEVPSHEIEYMNEITMGFLDVVLLAVVAKQYGHVVDTRCATSAVALAVAAIQLFVYNYWDGPHGGVGEPAAHYFEFIFEILSAGVSFCFCMDNKFLCDRSINKLLDDQQKSSINLLGEV